MQAKAPQVKDLLEQNHKKDGAMCVFQLLVHPSDKAINFYVDTSRNRDNLAKCIDNDFQSPVRKRDRRPPTWDD